MGLSTGHEAYSKIPLGVQWHQGPAFILGLRGIPVFSKGNVMLIRIITWLIPQCSRTRPVFAYQNCKLADLEPKIAAPLPAGQPV